MAVKIVVLKGSCPSRSRAVLETVAASLKRLEKEGIHCLEINFADYGYWDSPETIMISPAPILENCQGCVGVLPEAYLGIMPEVEFDQVLSNCIKKVYCR